MHTSLTYHLPAKDDYFNHAHTTDFEHVGNADGCAEGEHWHGARDVDKGWEAASQTTNEGVCFALKCKRPTTVTRFGSTWIIDVGSCKCLDARSRMTLP